jgi:4-hydroxybenzoate polyprenyltransferase
MDLLVAIVQSARPRQWLKNSFVLAPLLFSGRFRQGAAEWYALLALIAFTLISIATYFLNDIVDRERDRRHPLKKLRPIPSGRISVPLAVAVACACASVGLGIGGWINRTTLGTLAGYLLLQIAYTTWLKNQAIADVLCIAIGFVMRVIAGAVAIEVEPSSWLLVCTLFLATFLGFAKRSGEAVRMGTSHDVSHATRPVLIVYQDRLLLSLLSVTCSLTLLSYALYTVERSPPSPVLLATIPVVAYALFRYLLLVMRTERAESAETPEVLLVRDLGLIGAGIIWVAMCLAAMLLTPR